jgi:hypothetical protein
LSITFFESITSAGLEKSICLCPIEDRRELDSSREGMLLGFSLGNDLLLVDYTGRLFRERKTMISAELTGILNRLDTTAETWQARLEKLKSGRLLGGSFAGCLPNQQQDRASVSRRLAGPGLS